MVHGETARRVRWTRRAVIAGLLGLCLLTLDAASATARSAHRRAQVTAVNAKNRHRLPQNPALHRGDRVILTAPGFARGARVVVAVMHYRHLATTRASRKGVVVYRFTVPRRLGRGSHRLIFSGRSGAYRRRAPPLPRRSVPRRRPAMVVEVTVPYHPIWRFRVVAGHHARRSHAVRGVHGHRATTSAQDAAHTGSDLAALVIAGAALLLIGVLLAILGRTRRRCAMLGR